MQEIYLITDYNDRFGSKYTAIPYRSGMNKAVLSEEFANQGFKVIFLKASEVFEKIKKPEGLIFLYTSLEDKNSHYKSFIEDVIYALSLSGAYVIPGYRYLKGHNNKVFIELLRKQIGAYFGDNLSSHVFGSYEELKASDINFNFPVVLKSAEGFKSRNVYLIYNKKELFRTVKKISRTVNLKEEIKDIVRKVYYKDFKRESFYRRKFIVQDFIPGLDKDYKILVFGDKYYVLGRYTRKNDFRASGSGNFYFPENLPDGLLDFSEKIFSLLDVPVISLDVGYDSNNFYVFELQVVFFGTYTIEKSDFYFQKKNREWEKVRGKSILEREYALSMARYIRRKGLLK